MVTLGLDLLVSYVPMYRGRMRSAHWPPLRPEERGVRRLMDRGTIDVIAQSF